MALFVGQADRAVSGGAKAVRVTRAYGDAKIDELWDEVAQSLQMRQDMGFECRSVMN